MREDYIIHVQEKSLKEPKDESLDLSGVLKPYNGHRFAMDQDSVEYPLMMQQVEHDTGFLSERGSKSS